MTCCIRRAPWQELPDWRGGRTTTGAKLSSKAKSDISKRMEELAKGRGGDSIVRDLKQARLANKYDALVED